MKNCGKSSRGRSHRVPKLFRAPISWIHGPYGAHCAVIFAIAQLSCWNWSGGCSYDS